MAWDWLIWTGTGAFTVALIPQLVRTVQRGSANDLSIAFVALILFASACTLAYWLQHAEYVAAGGFVANLIVWSVVLRYRLWPRRDTPGGGDGADVA